MKVTGLEDDKGAAQEKPRRVAVALSEPDVSASSSDKDFVRALQQAAKSEAEILEKFGTVPDRARKLRARADLLVGALDREFGGTAHREDVSRELEAAKLILPGVAERTEKVSANAIHFLKTLADAPVAPTAPSQPDKASKGPAPKGKQPRVTRSKPDPTVELPAQSSPPATKPDDFNP